MTRARRTTAVLALLLTLPVGPVSSAAPAPAPARYELEKADRKEEKKRFLERLKKDRAKVDVAVDHTKTLIGRSRQRPYLPDLYLRLAELYVEKSRLAYFIRVEETPEGVKSLEHLESNLLKKQAVEVYQRLLDEFPGFPQRDKVLFFLAHEYRELGQIDQMLVQYREILTRFKNGPYAPESYLLLGDHFFNAKDVDEARRHYEAVLGYPGSPAVAAARYKLGWCHINAGDWKSAIKLFEQAVATPDADRPVEIDTYRKVDIRLESLVDIAYCYCEEYKEATPDEAVRSFERYAWSRPALMVGLEKLAQRYYVKKKWQHAAHVYRKLASLRNDPEKLLEYAGKVFECVRATGGFERADEDLALIVKALKKQRYSVHVPEATRERNLAEFELYARDIVTHLHERARADDSAQAFRLAAAAYRTYLDFFDRGEARAEMQRNFAEALFAGKEFLEAGKVYERNARAAGLKDREREEALYGAVVSYHDALKDKERLGAYGRVFARAGLRATGKEYAAAYPQSDKVPSVLFNVAWVAYEEGKYETAVEEFSRFVEAYPARREAAAAVHLVLDAYNLREDFQGLTRFGERVVANGALDEGLRREVSGIVRAAEGKVVTPLALAAARDWEAGKRELSAFADDNRTSSVGEQALQTLAVTSAQKRDLRALADAAARLLERTAAPDRVEQTLNLLVETSLQASQYRELARHLEEFARRLPGHKGSPEFLSRAAELRASLGETERALADCEAALPQHRAGSPERAALALRAADLAAALGAGDRSDALLAEAAEGAEGAALARVAAKRATLRLLKKSPGEAEPFRALALARWKDGEGKPDADVAEAVAEMESARLALLRDEYLGVRLGDRVDDDLVARKGALLDGLRAGYHEVIGFQRPRWALTACYRAYEAEEEFARFLREAPLPELSADEKVEYLGFLNLQVEEHRGNAQQYLSKCLEMARRWEVCDPELAAFFLAGGQAGARPFSPPAASAPGPTAPDEKLLAAHAAVLAGPTDPAASLALAGLYLEAGDAPQAALVAREAAAILGDRDPKARASLLNLLGVAHLYQGRDAQARDAFRRASEADPAQAAAKLNLAALYRHYEHAERADALYAELDAGALASAQGDPVHPHSLELYHAFHPQARR